MNARAPRGRPGSRCRLCRWKSGAYRIAMRSPALADLSVCRPVWSGLLDLLAQPLGPPMLAGARGLPSRPLSWAQPAPGAAIGLRRAPIPLLLRMNAWMTSGSATPVGATCPVGARGEEDAARQRDQYPARETVRARLGPNSSQAAHQGRWCSTDSIPHRGQTRRGKAGRVLPNSARGSLPTGCARWIPRVRSPCSTGGHAGSATDRRSTAASGVAAGDSAIAVA